MIGSRIVDLDDLFALAQSHRSVVVPKLSVWKKPRPAAFMMNLTGQVLLELITAGMYEYKKEPKQGVR